MRARRGGGGHGVARLIGYARVTADNQNLSLQIHASKQAGCSGRHIFRDKTSGARARVLR